ncbi:unnamed protein product [Gulo gulo]|uniref:Uncharacterized protein n=1 Tax=Gulo gulo TaxID=48420 RepID=A0A9X9M0T4_GULGU|nr:unnamed protein product [Gulo gulo]
MPPAVRGTARPLRGWALNANGKKSVTYFFSSLHQYFKPSQPTGDTYNCIFRSYYIILTLGKLPAELN